MVVLAAARAAGCHGKLSNRCLMMFLSMFPLGMF